MVPVRLVVGSRETMPYRSGPRTYQSNWRIEMNDQQKKELYSGARDQEIRAALDQHWAASDANDFETEHRIYHEDAVLDTRSQASEPAVEATYRASALVSQAKNGLLSDESLAAVIFGSPNSS
jgi:hypothetical protein